MNAYIIADMHEYIGMAHRNKSKLAEIRVCCEVLECVALDNKPALAGHIMMLRQQDERLAQEGDRLRIRRSSFLENGTAYQYGCSDQAYGEQRLLKYPMSRTLNIYGSTGNIGGESHRIYHLQCNFSCLCEGRPPVP